MQTCYMLIADFLSWLYSILKVRILCSEIIFFLLILLFIFLSSAQLGVVCKLTEGALNPLIQITDKDIKQKWPQNWALGIIAHDRPPTGFNSIPHSSLGLVIHPVFYAVKSIHSNLEQLVSPGGRFGKQSQSLY